jgi:hypothetical protein
MKLILILDLPSLDPTQGLPVAQQFVDALVASSVNDDAIIHTVTSMVSNASDAWSNHV